MGLRVKRTRASNTWTEARFKTFIRDVLRAGSRKWRPINEVRSEARVSRGLYLCNGCKQEVSPTIKIKNKTLGNIFVDHIKPVVSGPDQTWDEYIENLFCEKNNLQLLCKECHDNKTKKERE